MKKICLDEATIYYYFIQGTYSGKIVIIIIEIITNNINIYIFFQVVDIATVIILFFLLNTVKHLRKISVRQLNMIKKKKNGMLKSTLIFDVALHDYRIIVTNSQRFATWSTESILSIRSADNDVPCVCFN